MQLIGAAVEEKELTGYESLKELLDSFLNSKYMTMDGNFPAINNFFLQEAIQRQKNVASAARELLSEVPLESQKEDFDIALGSLIATYVYVEMAKHYPEIDVEMFNIKRIIKHDVKDRYDKSIEASLEIPLFARVQYGAPVWSVERTKEFRDSTYKTNISSKTPAIPREIKQQARNARANYMRAVASAYETDFGDLLMRNEKKIPPFGLEIYWIPNESDLEIEETRIDKDPILVADLASRKFLVAQWEVKHEIPYKHYLAEFLRK